MKAYLAIAVSILVWSNSFLAIPIAMRELTPIELTVLRFAPLGVLAAFWLAGPRERSVRASLRGNWGKIAAAALFQVPAYNLLLYEGQKTVSPALAALIIGSSPIFTYLIAVGFRMDRWKKSKGAGLILAFAGLYFGITRGMNSEFSSSTWSGPAMLFASALCMSVYVIINRLLLRQISSRDLSILTLVAGGLPMMLFLDARLVAKLMEMSLSTWISLFYLTVLATALGFYTWLYALERLPISNVVVFANAIPLLTLLFGWLFFGLVPSAALAAGCLILAAGVYIVNRAR